MWNWWITASYPHIPGNLGTSYQYQIALHLCLKAMADYKKGVSSQKWIQFVLSRRRCNVVSVRTLSWYYKVAIPLFSMLLNSAKSVNCNNFLSLHYIVLHLWQNVLQFWYFCVIYDTFKNTICNFHRPIHCVLWKIKSKKNSGVAED